MKFKNELIVVCLILFILISISAVSAANVNTNVTTVNNDNSEIININNVNGDVLTQENDGSFADLNDTINGDSSTNIILDRDYTYSSTDTIKTGILISKNNTVIDGQGHTIDAKGQTRIFNITGTTVILKNIKFINGNVIKSSGGAIFGYGENLRVFNCTFLNNNASWGGAIYSNPTSYSCFVNSTFIDNTANYGGALSTIYGLRQDVVNCTFDSNYAKYGGALLIYGELATTENPYDTKVNIVGSVFTNNEASEGDAISNFLSAIINMTDSIILGNSENLIDSWGAMFFADNNWWGSTVDNMSVRPNIAKNVRFTKWLYLNLEPHIETSSATISINNAYDSQTNQASSYSTSKLPSINVDVDAVNATFDSNNVSLDHSGKYELNFLLLGDSVLSVNYEGSSVSKRIKIGGLSELGLLIRNADDDSVITLDKDYVYTPGIDLPNRRILITDKHNIVIDGNGHTINAMGETMLFGVDKDSSDITFKNMKLVNAYSNDEQDGPAGYILALNTKFINCTFADNTATGISAGGALHVNAMNVSIIDCKFINNTHLTSSAGAVFLRGEGATIANTLFENNTATSYHSRAGALLLYDGGNLVNCTFVHNIADFAGAVFNYGFTSMDDCSFISNIALADSIQYEDGYVGGAGAVYANNVTITNSRFINNTAYVGPAVVISSSSDSIDRSIFINNTATSYNGIIFGATSGGKVTNSIFLNNNVPYSGYLISTIWGNLKADYNWYGNIAKNYDSTPNVSNLADMTKWLFLNATSVFSDEGKKLTVQFNFFAYDQNTKNVISYDLDDFPEINFAISTQNLTINKNVFEPGETIEGNLTHIDSIGEDGIYTIYDYKGTVTAQYECVKYTVPFSYQQSTWIEANSTFVLAKGENKYLNYLVHPFEDDYMPFLNLNGRITYIINDTSVIKINRTSGKVQALKVGLATVTIKFDGKDAMGREKYTPSNVTVLVNVTKIDTHIKINVAPDHLYTGETSYIRASVYDYKNRTVSYVTLKYINHNPELLSIDEVMNVKGIGEGVANITFHFDGNDDYLPSSLDLLIEVGRRNPNLEVTPDNISIKLGETYPYIYVNPVFANTTYISNDTSVAILDDDGVHGIGEGVANITIFFEGNDKYLPATVYLIVNVTAEKTYIDVNQTQKLLLTDVMSLSAMVRDSNGKLVSYSLNYTVNDTSVVSIDEYGIVTALKEGVANITVVFNGKGEYLPSKTNVIVTVTTGESIIDVDSDVEIILNQNVKLNAKLNHEGNLNYTSSNPDVVSVDKWGYIYAKKIGEAIITINYEGSQKYDPCTKNVTVRVLQIPTNIEVEKTFAWFIDENDTIHATLNPQKAGKLNFTSNNESVIKVDNNGKITAMGVGKTTIFISFDGNENYLPCNETIEVTVYSTDIPTVIEVNKTIGLFVDDRVDIGAVLNPSNAGDLNYVSSDSSVVSIDENGKITAKKVGQANITVSFNGNERYLSNKTTVLVTVSLIPTSIKVNSSISVNITENVDLGYVFSHPEAGSLKFIFTDYSIASIENGKIFGDEVGKTNLTIKFNGDDKYAACNATVEINVVDVETTIDVEDSLKVNLTETGTIVATLNPKEAGKLRFISNNKDIISVDGKGNVYGIKVGNGTVTVIFDGEGKYRSVNKTVTVTVMDVKTTIDAADSIELNVTESATIVANLTPIDAGKLHFNTNDNDIISLDEKGNIKGLKVGNATVLITFDANGKYSSANKTVTVIVSDVKTDIIVDEDIELAYGDETNIDATLTPGGVGKLAFNSSDINIITIDENGNIKAIKPGEATIIVSYEGKGKYAPSNKTVKVTVKRASTSIKIDDTLNMEIGVGHILKPVSNPLNIPLTFVSNNTEIVEVNDEGFVFGSRSGNALVTISFAGNEYYLPSNASITVSVNSRMTEIRVNNTITIGFGDSMSMGAFIYVPVFNSKLNGELKYVSSNPDIVSVDEHVGFITANDVGNATITITYAGDSIYDPSNATVNVEVTTKTTSIKVDKTSLSLYVEDEYDVIATLLSGPDGATLTYISNNPNVALVNPVTGHITARSAGNATITVRYAGDSDYHSSETNISVNVSKYKTQIKSENSFDIEVYETKDLGAFSTPNDGILTYISSDEEVVSVDASGNIKGLKAGSAIITIKFAGDNKYLPSQKQVIVSVSKIKTEINLTDMEFFAGEEYQLTNVVVPQGVPTKPRYYEYTSDDLDVFDVDNGVITTFYEGTAELTVKFLGNDVYAPSSKTVVVTVVKKVISADEYNFTFEVDDDAGRAIFTAELPEDAEGMFQVIIDDEPYAEYITDGKAIVEIDELEPGDHKVTLRYTGDQKYASINDATTFHIGKFKIDKNKDVDVTLGSYATYTVHLTKDTQAMEGKTITFKVNGKTYKATTDRLGYASVKVKLPAMKTYTITAKFGSVKVSNKIKVHVIVAKNLKTTKKKDLKVQITLKKVNKKYLSGKKVTLKFNGKTYTAKTNSKGVATFTISKSLFAKLKVGKSYKYTVKYSTDTVTKNIKIF